MNARSRGQAVVCRKPAQKSSLPSVVWIQFTEEIKEPPVCYQEVLAGTFLGEK